METLREMHLRCLKQMSAIYIVCVFFDLLLTYVGIEYMGVAEFNPLMKLTFDTFGLQLGVLVAIIINLVFIYIILANAHRLTNKSVNILTWVVFVGSMARIFIAGGWFVLISGGVL